MIWPTICNLKGCSTFRPNPQLERSERGQCGVDAPHCCMLERELDQAATSDYLLRGTVFALEQCGLLLRDARILCEAGSYASAVVLTALAARKLKAPSSMAKWCGST